MHAKHVHEAPLFKRILLFAMALILVLTAAPIKPVLADAEPEPLPIYVGWQQFAHTGPNANVSNDGTRVLNFPANPGRLNAATTASGRLRVVPVTNDSSGIVVRSTKIKLEGGFSTYFVMHLNGSTSLDHPGFPGPADGLTFIIQDNPTPRIGGVGEGVGYAGIPNSIGVEFDTWRNYGVERGVKYEDPNTPFNRFNKYHPITNPSGPTADHVALVMNGNNHHRAESGDVIDNLQGANFRLYDYGASNAYVHVWVEYDDNGLLTATYGLSSNRSDANNRRLTRDVGTSLLNKEVYVGFGASTGGANSHHDILAWYFKDSYVPEGLNPNGNYKQGPSAVTISKAFSGTGSQTGIDIKVKGNSASQNLPDESVDIYINGERIDGEHRTNSEGVLIYNFDDSSNLQVGSNTITVVSRSGGTSANTSVVQTVSPSAGDLLLSYTTDGVVTIDGVPSGVDVTLYDENNEVIATSSVATNGTVRLELTGTDKEKITNASPIKISYSKTGEVPSTKVSVTPALRSNAPEAGDITTNATTSTVTVKNVPPGAIVNVYAPNGEVIGTATNNEDAEAVVIVTINPSPGLTKGDVIRVTITEPSKLESERVSSVANSGSAPLDTNKIKSNATDNKVTIKDVPPGATINVYDDNHVLIGTATNSGPSTEVVVAINPPHELQTGTIVKVTITETGKLESEPVQSEAKQETLFDGSKVETNATTNTVTVQDVPPNATIHVYNKNGEVIGTATNTGSSDAAVVVTIASPHLLQEGDTVKVTLTEDGKLESKPVSSEAKVVSDSIESSNVVTNATNNTVTVNPVPPGATINVYDKNGKLIGTATNTGTSDGAVVVTIASPYVLAKEETVTVTITKAGKLESTPLPNQAKLESEPPSNSNVDASVPKGSVTVKEVPEGAVIIIYDEAGTELKRHVHPGPGTKTVVIEGLNLEPGTKIQVTVTEKDKLESKPLNLVAALTTDEAIDAALRNLQIGYSANDTWESVTLPVLVVTTGAHDTKIQWSSSKPAAIEIKPSASETVETLVHRGKQDESVILTAAVSKNGVTKTRTFLLIVKAENLTKTTVENYRQVNVTGGASNEVNEQVGIHRISLSNGLKIDKAIFNPAAATQFVNDLRTKNGFSTLYVDEKKDDEPDEIAVEIAGKSVELLNNNGNSLHVRTEYATISIARDVLGQMADRHLDLFFRLIPVKDTNQQTVLNRSIVNEAVVTTAAGSKVAEVIGSSLQIETNYHDYTTTLFLPLAKNGITLPANNVDSFLQSLRVYVEHSDGEKVVKTPTVVYDNNTPIGLEITIDKFSTFSILQLKDRSVGFITVLPVSQETKQQVQTATIDRNKGTIVLELEDGSGAVDKSGFEVTIGGKTLKIDSITIEGNKVIINLKDLILAGYEAAISYTPGSTWTSGGLKPFTNLAISNPGHHVAYIKGFPDGTFRPENTITRAEMSAILARNKNLSDSYAYQKLFPDVADGFWATAYIEQLNGTGLLIGDNLGNFRPNERITRAEIAMIAARWLQADLDGTFVSSFKDVSDKHWAAAAIAAVSKAGVMIGFEDGTFGLDQYVTRSQAVTIMNRLLGRGPLTGVPTPTWPDVLPSHWASEHIEEASQDHYYLYLPDGKEQLFKQ